jgi:NTP pyrophosphatase (non-canonical NTP hydrolase)
VTGVTMENQSTVDEAASSESSSSSFSLSWSEFLTNVPTLVTTIQEFANERQWTKFHTPRNLVLALLGEVGELAELVQWKGDMDDVDNVDVDHHNNVDSDNEPGMTTTKLASLLSVSERDKLSQEIADVSIYLLRLVSVTSVTEALMDHLLLRQHQ